MAAALAEPTAGCVAPEPSKEEDADENDIFVFTCRGVRVQVEQRRQKPEEALPDEDLTGDLVWPTAQIFCRYLCGPPVREDVEERAAEEPGDGPAQAPDLRGRRVLDVGAGTGLVGLVAASLGAKATLVDMPRVLPLLTHNVAKAAAGDVAVQPLMWGDVPALERLKAERGPFDVILCCEVVYQQLPEVLEALQRSLDFLLARPGGVLVFAYQPRDGCEYTDAVFFQSLPAAARVRLVAEEPLSAWDGSWDDAELRKVRTYIAEGGPV